MSTDIRDVVNRVTGDALQQLLAAIAATPRLDYTPTHLGADDGPDDEWLDEWSSGRRAEIDENFTVRSWP